MPPDSPSTRAIASRSCLLALGWVGITAALFGIGELVVHSHAIADFDRHVTNWVVNHRTPALDSTMRVATWIGSWVAVAVTGGAVLVLTMTKRSTTTHLVLFGVAWAGEYGMVNLIKLAVGRPRPPKDLWLISAHGASFPSGHAANATLVCVTASLVAFLFLLRPAVRTAVVILAGLVFATVGFSRVELGVHWTTDVVAAGLATMVWLAVITSVWHLCATRRSRTTTEQTGDAAVHRMSRRPPCTSALAGATRSSHLLTGALRVRTSLVKTMSCSNTAELRERIGVSVRGPLNLTE